MRTEELQQEAQELMSRFEELAITAKENPDFLTDTLILCGRMLINFSERLEHLEGKPQRCPAPHIVINGALTTETAKTLMPHIIKAFKDNAH
ncbi:MAG: hypothetical protein WC291_12100 [Thermodesulfovibrionales bacterium]|jgi:hypothetical protein